MAPHVDPLVGAAGDIGIGVESAECLDGVHLLYAEGFAMADQRRCILSVEHVFRQYGHVARTHATVRRSTSLRSGVMNSARLAVRAPYQAVSLFAVFFIFIEDFQVTLVAGIGDFPLPDRFDHGAPRLVSGGAVIEAHSGATRIISGK